MPDLCLDANDINNLPFSIKPSRESAAPATAVVPAIAVRVRDPGDAGWRHLRMRLQAQPQHRARSHRRRAVRRSEGRTAFRLHPAASRPISTSNCAGSPWESSGGKQRHNFGGRPRESGTHNHRAALLRSSVAPACSKRTAWGYGSRLALPPSLFELWRTTRLAGTTVLLVFTPFYAAATCFFGGKRP
jgi:hypothetical protein